MEEDDHFEYEVYGPGIEGNDEPLNDNNDEPVEEDDIDDNINEDVDRLKVAMLNEINIPDLLPYEEVLIDDMREQVRNQQMSIDELETSKSNKSTELFFTNKLYQMEIDRVKYLIATYLRTRIKKIEKFSLYLLKTPEMKERLSPQEKEYLSRYADLIENHFHKLAMSEVPTDLNAIDEDQMVEAPNLDTFVFCESKEDLGQMQIDKSGVEQIEMNSGDRHILRYRVVQKLLLEGKVRMI